MTEKTKPYEKSVRTYLPPLYARLTKAMAEYAGISESRVVADSVKERFDKMPIQERTHILNMAKK
jgi:hypothetical protein